MAAAVLLFAALGVSLAAVPARALERPWVSDVFFYWYEWNDQQQWGSWANGGVYYTPIAGYYDSRLLETNRRQVHTAAEWGMTHHFMDYWTPEWQGEGGVPRDRILMEAAEAVRAAGYQAWMAYYQDGSNFAMREFARNVSERRDVYNWLRNYAPFAAWPRLKGYPFQLVYGRNGAPEVTRDDAGFREFARRRYGSLEAANGAWGTDYKSFDDVHMSFDLRGPQRADAVDYQYLLWEQEWAKLNQLVREQFGYPGIKVSFDVGYAPFRGFGFCDFARVFGGPHSYAGVFGPPHEQDVERFIQSIVAKRYDTVFFDHLKGYYCDWNTVGRIPGTQYPADPFAYDRFWVGDLMRYNEAVLHLSWNEWWEGSNLEPSLELGKEYCEKNLFYSTLMQACFPSLRDFGKGASAAVLLNDWAFKCGSDHTSEIYAVIQELRRSMVPFDLVVDDQVTPETLRRFDLIFAPAAGVGFGRNARGESIAELLVKWADGGRRRLVTSDCRQLRELLGVQVQPPAESAAPGPDLSEFVEIGEPGDERCLLSGFSGREEWSQLPEGGYGEAGEKYTVRWTPADSSSLRLLLPVSPNRNHILRFSGTALRPNEISIEVGGKTVDRVSIQEGAHDYRASLPRSAIGSRSLIEVEFAFAQQIIPREIDPARFPSENRICNLALDWVQISTANLDFSREQIYTPPSPLVDFVSPIYGGLAGQAREASIAQRDNLVSPGAEIAARYRAGGVPRDMVLRGGQVLYVNGRMDEAAPEEWIAAVLQHWAGAKAPTRVAGESIIGAALRDENTVILLAYNYDPSQSRSVEFTVDGLGRRAAQVTALRRDGESYTPVPWRTDGDRVRFSDTLRYFGVYEVVFAPVKVEVGEVVLHPGEQGRLSVNVTAGADAVNGSIALVSVVPSIVMNGEPVPFRARRGETIRVDLPVSVREDAEWGRKTVGVRVETPGGAAVVFRPLELEANANVTPVAAILDGRRPRLTLANTPPSGASRCGRAGGVYVEVAGNKVSFGEIAGGARTTRALPLAQPFAGRPRLMKVPATVSYDLWGQRVARECDLDVAVIPAETSGPADALAAVYVFNAGSEPLENYPVIVGLPSSLGALAERLYVEDADGRALPTQVDLGAELSFIGRVPATGAATFYLMLAPDKERRPAAAGSRELAVEPLSRLTGTVRLANSLLSLVISAPGGGTLASLRSQATGRDYAADSLGMTYGTWSRPVTLESPARQPQQLIAEQRVRQSDSRAEVEVLASGPVRGIARVTWEDARVRCRQTYELRAFQPYLRLHSEIAPKEGFSAQELVLLDGRFNATGFTKIFPGFSGMLGGFENEHPHFGWREGGYVPPVATIMAAPDFAESLSLVLLKSGGADRWRQGFWPQQRPQPGRCRYAWCELASTAGKGGEVEAYVLVHRGNQAAAEKFRAGLECPPLAVIAQVSRESKREGKRGGAGHAADWWSPCWSFRAPVRVRVAASAHLPLIVSARVSASQVLRAAGAAGRVDANSVRVIEVGDKGAAVAMLPAVAQADADLSVSWEVMPSSLWRGERSYHIYFDTVETGPRASQPVGVPGSLAALADPSLEAEGRYWALEGSASWSRDDAHYGRVAARLESDGQRGLGLVKAPNFPAAPNSEYRVSFWAKALEGEGLLRVNFFIDAAHDYPQPAAQVPADGQWHRIEVIATTGDIPAGLRPALRIWAIERKQVTLVDDITVELPESAAAIAVEVGEIEAL
jgi:hypothetical protein